MSLQFRILSEVEEAEEAISKTIARTNIEIALFVNSLAMTVIELWIALQIGKHNPGVDCGNDKTRYEK